MLAIPGGTDSKSQAWSRKMQTGLLDMTNEWQLFQGPINTMNQHWQSQGFRAWRRLTVVPIGHIRGILGLVCWSSSILGKSWHGNFLRTHPQVMCMVCCWQLALQSQENMPVSGKCVQFQGYCPQCLTIQYSQGSALISARCPCYSKGVPWYP